MRPAAAGGVRELSIADGQLAIEGPSRTPLQPLSTRQIQAIRRNLLRWYDVNRRDLPWRRREGEAYAQWVAEIMLQQTRVETVVPYYLRFLSAFSTVSALAEADEERVLKHWEGLGYYRRVLYLHRAAKQLAAAGAEVPHTAVELRALPGIGEYTAAAIASIAGGEAVAAVDGNVARVIARLIGLRADVLSSTGKRKVQAVADALLSRRRSGDFNQAWMDLGSLVCTPRGPNCGCCPLARQCSARAGGLVHELPRRGTERVRKIPLIRCVAVYVRRKDRVLVRRRPPGGLWSGLWEFPNKEVVKGQMERFVLESLLKKLGGGIEGTQRLGCVTHQLTHRRMRFTVFCGTGRSTGSPQGESLYRWVTEAELSGLAMATVQRRIERMAAQ